MKKFLYFLCFVGFLIEIVVFVRVYKNKKESQVLGQAEEVVESPAPSPVETPTFSPSPIPTKTSTPTASASATPKATVKSIPQPNFSSEEINGFIERFAAQYSIDPNVLRHLALCESGFDPGATNLSYAGLFQFRPTTWKNLRIEMGEDPNIDLRFNAEEATRTAAYAIHIGRSGIFPNCMP